MEKLVIQSSVVLLIAPVIAAGAFNISRSIDRSGAFMGFLFLALHFAVGYRFGALLLAFFITSSKLIKVGEDKKQSIDADFKEG